MRWYEMKITHAENAKKRGKLIRPAVVGKISKQKTLKFLREGNYSKEIGEHCCWSTIKEIIYFIFEVVKN